MFSEPISAAATSRQPGSFPSDNSEIKVCPLLPTSVRSEDQPVPRSARLKLRTYNVRMPSMHRRQFLGQMAVAPAVQSPAASPGRPRNVLLMIADDLGLFLPSYGDPNASMPRIEQTAREGVRFENAFCTTASCSASRSVILSGRYNHANGQYGHAHAEHHFSYLPEIRPMPRLLKDAGYATGYIGKLHVAPEERFGWDLADPIGSRDVFRMSQIAKNFLKSAGSKPWYLHCGFHDPHRA